MFQPCPKVATRKSRACLTRLVMQRGPFLIPQQTAQFSMKPKFMAIRQSFVSYASITIGTSVHTRMDDKNWIISPRHHSTVTKWNLPVTNVLHASRFYIPVHVMRLKTLSCFVSPLVANILTCLYNNQFWSKFNSPAPFVVIVHFRLFQTGGVELFCCTNGELLWECPKKKRGAVKVRKMKINDSLT